MFLRPREKKFKKEIKGKISGIMYEQLSFGIFGIYSLEYGRITARQIEAVRRIISKKIKFNNGKLWISAFPSKPVSKKPNEVRMGKGKGPVSFWVATLKPGKLLYEFDGVNLITAKKIYKAISYKLPIKVGLNNKFFEF